MPKRQSELLAEEMEILRAEVELIAKMDVPADEAPDAVRADFDSAQERSDIVRTEWKAKKALYDKAVEREKAIDEIRRAHAEQTNNEPGTRRGPEVKRTRDAFEGDAEMDQIIRSVQRSSSENPTVNFEPDPVIERARYAIDQIPVNMGRNGDEIKGRLHDLIDRDDDKNSALIARHLIITGSKEYRDQFKEYVRSYGRHVPDLLRTAMSLSSTAGGVLVPHYLDPTIVLTNAGVYAGTIRSLATVRQIGVTKWEGVSSAGVTAAWIGEAASASDGSPTFGTPSITTQKAVAWLTGSYEVFEDSGFSTDLSMLLGDAKARLEEVAFATGNTGASVPRGVVSAVQAVTASIVTSATTGTFVRGDVDSVNNAINPRQEANMAWLANKAVYSKIRAFDTAGGSAFWANLQVGQPPILLGVPALKSASMTNVIGNGTNILLAGDFSNYYIIDRIGMSVIYDPLVKTTASGAAPTGQAGWYAHWRVGADVVNADAFRLLQLNQVAAATALG